MRPVTAVGCACGFVPSVVTPAISADGRRKQQLAALSVHQRSDECAESRRMRIESMQAAIRMVIEDLVESLDEMAALRAELDAIEARYIGNPTDVTR